jgi:hypothetical protein
VFALRPLSVYVPEPENVFVVFDVKLDDVEYSSV